MGTVRSNRVLIVPRVVCRVLSRRSTRRQNHRLPLVVEDHYFHPRLLIAARDLSLSSSSESSPVGGSGYSTAGLGASECMYGLTFSRSSIADSTYPHPSPDCMT